VSALNYPIYSLTKLYKFPVYMTRDEYKAATGQEAPEWNSDRAPKYWFDPAAKNSPKMTVVYDCVIATAVNGVALVSEDGKPVTDLLVLSRNEAASVNIPPKVANVPGADVPAVQVPLRELEANEELFFSLGGVVSVKNTTLYSQLDNGFTVKDREILMAIASKLGL
jgi:hypothetical protein